MGPVPQLVLDLSVKMRGSNCWVDGKRQDFQVLLGEEGDTRRIRSCKERKGFLPCFRGTKGDQPCEILNGVAIGHFSRWKVRVLSWN